MAQSMVQFKEKKMYKGSVSMSRTRGNDYDKVHITLTDESSGCQVMEAYLPLEEFAKAITGQGYVNCDFEIYNTEVIGKKREVKTEAVPVPENERLSEKSEKAELLKPFEVDGWVGRDSDLGNHHNIVYNTDSRGKKAGLRRENGNIFYWVSFHRFVD